MGMAKANARPQRPPITCPPLTKRDKSIVAVSVSVSIYKNVMVNFGYRASFLLDIKLKLKREESLEKELLNLINKFEYIYFI